MPSTASILSLGTRQDAVRWRDQVQALGATIVRDIREPKPSVDTLRSFFGGSEDWLFIAGHFIAPHLFNEAANKIRLGEPADPADSVRIAFSDTSVTIEHGTAAPITLAHGGGFKQTSVKAVFWGGCNTNSAPSTVNNMRTLFGDHTLIGWKGITGWQILHTVMGGFGHGNQFPDQDFFQRLGSTPDDPATIRDAWLGSAIDATWGNAQAEEETNAKFSVIDPNGSGYRIHNGAIASDPMFHG